jgi:hypothetical protein
MMIIGMFGGIRVLGDLLTNWSLNIGVAITGLYLSGYYIGKKMDFLINHTKSYPIVTGMIGLFLILLIGILSGSSVGFIQEGFEQVSRNGNLSDALFDYYIKPLYWILIFGFIPTFLAGGVLGFLIKTPAL